MQNTANTRIYHGNLRALELAQILKAEFNRGNYAVQTFGKPNKIVLQISTQRNLRAGGQTALSVSLTDIEDGVIVQMEKQKWLGVAASMGITAIATVMNPINLINRLDDIAQDVESFQIADTVWAVVDNQARLAGASTQLSQRLRRITCEYCGSAVKPGEPTCIACGAPLGDSQPRTCLACGYVAAPGDRVCSNCHQPLKS